MEKLSKTAKVLDKIVNVLSGICIALVIMSAILLIIAAVIPENQFYRLADLSATSISFGFIEMQLSEAIPLQGPVRLTICIILAGLMTVSGLLMRGFRLLRNILAPMKESRPFDDSVPGNIRKLALLTLIGGIVSTIFTTAIGYAEILMYDLPSLLPEGLVTKYTFQVHTDGTFLLAAALLFLLSYVFQYGAELQRESDETL